MKKNIHIVIYILLILVSIATIFPFLWMVMNSFNSSANVFAIPPKIIPDKFLKPGMFSNYSTVLKEFNFARYTLNSFIVAGGSALGQVITCTLAGFAFALMKFKGKRIIFAAILVTMMVPIQVTIIPEFLLMMKLRWLDTYAPLIIPSVLIGSFGTFMFKEFFESVPKSMIDAGSIDGANSFRMYFNLYLPQSHAQLATLFIIAFMNNWNDLLRPILYINSEKLQTVTMALTQFQSQYTAKWNLLLTGGVLSIIPLLIIYISLQRFIIQGIATTGTKG
jgi:multiple sugar transport system permease protein